MICMHQSFDISSFPHFIPFYPVLPGGEPRERLGAVAVSILPVAKWGAKELLPRW